MRNTGAGKSELKFDAAITTHSMTKNTGKQQLNTDQWEHELDNNHNEEDSSARKRKTDVVPSKTSKGKSTNQDKGSKHESSQERRERRLRERREREAIETERRERERDFERKRHASVSRYKPRKPPVGYKDPHEACRQVVPESKRVKEEKRRQIKALMNCIAFEPEAGTVAEPEHGRPSRQIEDMDNSLSSDTTSDMTDVTPRSSSSGCSSMSKQSVTPERTEGPTDTELPRQQKTRRSKSEGRRAEDKSKTTDYNGNEHEQEELRYLQEALQEFDLDEETSDFATSIISGLSAERRAKCGKKNMTFSNDELREIERVNLILLRKIMAHKKKPRNAVMATPPHRKTSSAINRAKAEKNIEKENMVLLRKLQTVKGTTGSLASRKSVTSPTVC